MEKALWVLPAGVVVLATAYFETITIIAVSIVALALKLLAMSRKGGLELKYD